MPDQGFMSTYELTRMQAYARDYGAECARLARSPATDEQALKLTQAYEQGWEDGARIERERCATIAEGFDTCDPKYIVAAIRKDAS